MSGSLSASEIGRLRAPVDRGETRPASWRRARLADLEQLLRQHHDAILAALAGDLNKPPLEAGFEVIAVSQELRTARRRLRRWMAPERVPVPLAQRPGRARLLREPLGCVLIIAPWNYPFSLCLQPLVSALAAGNTAVLKPSEHAPATAALIAELVPRHLGDDVVRVVQGDGSVAAALLEQRFDHIFFTGGERVGRLVMAAAARHLTPVTLELGGKSPAIVLESADPEVTARRLIWGKGLNEGQTCIAPDHLLVQEPVRQPLLRAMAAACDRFYGPDPLASPDLGAIVNEAQYARLAALLERARHENRVLLGGACDPQRRRIAPTLIEVRDPAGDPLMQEELFGPLLPVIGIATLEEAIASVRSRPKPLALYLFGGDSGQRDRVLTETSSGSVCFNDVVFQAGVPELAFGGVGASGMGSYHGRAGFETFSHRRSVLSRPFRPDVALRYPPYGDRLALVRRLMG